MMQQKKGYYFVVPIFLIIGFLGSALLVAEFLPRLLQNMLLHSDAEPGEALLKTTYWMNLLSSGLNLLTCAVVLIGTVLWSIRSKRIYRDENETTRNLLSAFPLITFLVCVLFSFVVLDSDDMSGEIVRCRADMAVLRDGQLLEYTGYLSDIRAEPLAGTWHKNIPDANYRVRISDRLVREYEYFWCPLAFGAEDGDLLDHAGPYQVSYLPNTRIIMEMKEIDPQARQTSA